MRPAWRNGAYAPYAAFYFFTKEEEQKLTDGTNRVREDAFGTWLSGRIARAISCSKSPQDMNMKVMSRSMLSPLCYNKAKGHNVFMLPDVNPEGVRMCVLCACACVRVCMRVSNFLNISADLVVKHSVNNVWIITVQHTIPCK